jgi:hypothetical protein
MAKSRVFGIKHLLLLRKERLKQQQKRKFRVNKTVVRIFIVLLLRRYCYYNPIDSRYTPFQAPHPPEVLLVPAQEKLQEACPTLPF